MELVAEKVEVFYINIETDAESSILLFGDREAWTAARMEVMRDAITRFDKVIEERLAKGTAKPSKSLDENDRFVLAMHKRLLARINPRQFERAWKEWTKMQADQNDFYRTGSREVTVPPSKARRDTELALTYLEDGARNTAADILKNVLYGTPRPNYRKPNSARKAA